MLNLTMHEATAEQITAGVVEPTRKDDIKKLLLFKTMPTREEVRARALEIAKLAAEELTEETDKTAMIGGALFLMTPLVEALKEEGITPFFAFTEREVIEKTEGDATVKTAVFVHKGFVEA